MLSISVLGYSQTKKELPALDSLPYLTNDTTLNNFMLHWLGKPYKLGGKTERVKKDSLQIGDLLFFRSRQSPSGWHCATYIGETMFVHAANKYEGVKVSSLLEPRYKKAYKGAGRLKK